jgi:hypothetical protein
VSCVKDEQYQKVTQPAEHYRYVRINTPAH